MNDDDKLQLKEEIKHFISNLFLEFQIKQNEKNSEQDEKINRLTYISETQSKTMDKFLNFMEEQQSQGNKSLDKFKWLVVGAIVSFAVAFIPTIIKKCF